MRTINHEEADHATISKTATFYRIKLRREVKLEERVWMNKLCEHNKHAKGLVETLLCPDFIGEE